MPITDEVVTRLVKAIRAVLDKSDKSNWGVEWETFPRGCCGTVAELTQYCFIKIIDTSPTIVRGSRRKDGVFCTHAWIEMDCNVIDLTRDQYGPEHKYIFRNDPFYRTWSQCKEESPHEDILLHNHQALYFDEVVELVRQFLERKG